MNKKTRILSAVVLSGAIALGGSACGEYNTSHGKGDAPISGGSDNSPADCTGMPDGFSNVCTKCVHGAPGFRVMDNTAGRFAIVKDPDCTG